MNSKLDILLAGVGGQGTVFVSRLIAQAALMQGSFVRTSETIGMAQRGGTIVSHVRINSEKWSSIISYGAADVFIAFEPAEAVRNLSILSKDGCCIVNTQKINPVSASLGVSKYNLREIKRYIENNLEDVYFIDGNNIAMKAGDVKTANVVMLGAAIATERMPFSREIMLEAIKENVPDKYIDLNIRALEMGYEAISFGKN